MLLSRVQIKNFRNLADVDIALSQDIIIVGENRSGKSNFIHALRLVLDTTLPDSARYLKLADIWDGCFENEDGDDNPIVVEVHLDFEEFDDDDNLIALLTDYRLAADHNIARLSYVLRPVSEDENAPVTEADFEFKIFGGGDETRNVPAEVRRRISLDVLDALRDAEGTLGRWRNSPLRPLLEDAISKIDEDDLGELAEAINEATNQLTTLKPIVALENDIRTQMATLAGSAHDLRVKLGFVENDPHQLFRSLRVFIDDGKRGIGDASLGAANVALLTLRLAEFEWRRQKNERNYTLVAIEEPEAHLHPQLQRKVFRTLFDNAEDSGRSLILTTHSPSGVRLTKESV